MKRCAEREGRVDCLRKEIFIPLHGPFLCPRLPRMLPVLVVRGTARVGPMSLRSGSVQAWWAEIVSAALFDTGWS